MAITINGGNKAGGLGNASLRSVPASGNAATNEVVIGSDTRLSDSRTPTVHAASHATGGTDAISPSSIGALAVSALSSATPSAPGATGSAGTSSNVARADHVHAQGWTVQTAATSLPSVSSYPDGYLILVY